MILILEVASPQPMVSGASRQTFHEDGGSIGRESDNFWVLPHSKVSGHHAVISHRGGVYYIEDRSRNGVCINSSKNRLERGRPYALNSGDRILIEPYEIRVSLAPDHGDRPDARAASNPFDSDDPFSPHSIDSIGSSTPSADIPSQALDPLELLNLVPKRAPARKAPSSQDLQLGSPFDGHYQPPAVAPDPMPMPQAQGSSIPEGYDPLAPDDPFPVAPPPPERRPDPYVARQATPPPMPAAPPRPRVEAPPPVRVEVPASPRIEVPAPPRVEAPAPPRVEQVRALSEDGSGGARADDAAITADFAAVLAGAGLDPSTVTPEIARDFGQILRVVVAGVMDVMRSREQIKDEFRMQVTRVRPVENNPLKFSADVDDALHNLLVKRNRAYMSPIDAFEDAFADLRHHQIAMLAGMRMAFEAMLAQFDPDRLQQEFDRQMNKGLVPAKLRYWDLFREKRQEIVKDPEAAFRRLFGEEFARAYEEQLRDLRARERKAERASPKPPKESGD